MINLFAKPNQDLVDHCLAVGILAKEIFKTLPLKIKDNEKESLSNVALISGLLHDLGKCDPSFQEYLKNKKEEDLVNTEHGVHPVKKNKDTFTFEEATRHNELSWVFRQLFEIESSSLKLDYKYDWVDHVIFYHHPLLVREKEKDCISDFKNTYDEETWKEIIKNNRYFLKKLDEYYSKYTQSNISFFKELKRKENDLDYHNSKIPSWREGIFRTMEKDILKTLIRNSVILSDWTVSSYKNLEDIIKNKEIEKILPSQQVSFKTEGIRNYLKSFDNRSRRTKAQENLGKEAKGLQNISIQGPAGVGKTNAILQVISQEDRSNKIFWICPRILVCKAVFNLLKNISNTKIEICTSEDKEILENGTSLEGETFSGDIVVTTIDQMLSYHNKGSKVTNSITFLNSTMVYDEFHEFIEINLAIYPFKEAVLTIAKSINSKQIFASATPNPLFLKELEIPLNSFRLDPFHEAKYKFNFVVWDDENPIHDIKKRKGRLILQSPILPLVKTSLKRLIKGERSLLLHSKMKRKDSKNIFDLLMQNFGKNKKGKYDCVRSGPLCRASLDISFDDAHVDCLSFDSNIQIVGRINRWGDTSKISEVTWYLSSKTNTSEAAYLREIGKFDDISRKGFYFLKNLFENKEFTLKELYEAYFKFYEQEEIIDSWNKNFKKIIDSINVDSLKPTTSKRVKISKETSLKNKGSFRETTHYLRMVKGELTVSGEDLVVSLSNEFTCDLDNLNLEDTISVSEYWVRVKSGPLLSAANVTRSSFRELSKHKQHKLSLDSSADPRNPIYTSYTKKFVEDTKIKTRNLFSDPGWYLTFSNKNEVITLGLIFKSELEEIAKDLNLNLKIKGGLR